MRVLRGSALKLVAAVGRYPGFGAFPCAGGLGTGVTRARREAGYAQRTFVLGPRPYESPQRTLLALWTGSDPDRITAEVSIFQTSDIDFPQNPTFGKR
jgi:hypothetical protein